MSESFEYTPLLMASALLCVVSCWFMQYLIGLFNLRRMTIPGFWYLTYLVMIFIPSFFVFFEKDNDARYWYLFSVESLLITVPAGIFLANRLLLFNRGEIEAYFNMPIQEKESFVSTYLVLLMVAIGLTVLYLLEVDRIPLFYIMTHSGEYYLLAQLREDSFKLLDSRFIYGYSVLRSALYPFLIIISIGHYLHSGQRNWLFLFLITLILGIFYNALSIAKSPVALIFLLIFIFLYLFNGGTLTRKSKIMAIPVTLGFPLFVVYMISSIETSFELIIDAILKRLFFAPANGLYYYFEVFPDRIGYLHGLSVRPLAFLMNESVFDTANFVSTYMNYKGSPSGSANVAFIGNMNADFGMVGVLMGGVVVGFVMQYAQIYLLRAKKTILCVSVYAFLLFSFWCLHSTSFPTMFLSNGVFFVFIFFWFMEGNSTSS